jgi:hypothetical protein
MGTWDFDPMADAIRAEREREVAKLQLQRIARAARPAKARTTGTPRLTLSSLRHRLVVLMHRTQRHPSAPST